MAEFTKEQDEMVTVLQRVMTKIDDAFAKRDAHQRLLIVLAAQRSDNLDQVNWNSLRNWCGDWKRELERLGL